MINYPRFIDCGKGLFDEYIPKPGILTRASTPARGDNHRQWREIYLGFDDLKFC